MKTKVSGIKAGLMFFLLGIFIAGCGGGGGGTSGGAADTTAPNNTTASNFVNSGAATTGATSVTLAITATDSKGITGYYVSESPTTPAASASGWTAVASTTSYSANVSFTLSSGDGTKTVYVWFKDAAGNVSASASDTITLSTAIPSVGAKFPIATTPNTTSTDGTDTNPGRGR